MFAVSALRECAKNKSIDGEGARLQRSARFFCVFALMGAAFLPELAAAQEPDIPVPDSEAPAPDTQDPEAQAYVLPSIEVIAVTPVLGTGIAADRVPSNVQVLKRREIDALHPLGINDLLNQRIGSVTISDAQNNPLQPELSFRGFTASPLLGLPQGLAVYQNGARINDAFGDTVNFDLIPVFAIDNLQLIPAFNPVYGLNALGGSIALDMRNGFSFEGGEAEVSGGSFGRVRGTAQYGVNNGTIGFYAGISGFKEEGWRDESQSDLGQAYADLSIRKERFDLGASFLWADSDLNGNGASPIELLAVDRDAVFTYPDNTQNQVFSGQLRGQYRLTNILSLEGNAYYRRLRRDTKNGDETDIDECDSDPSLLCEEDGAGDVAEDLTGAAIEADDVGEEPFAVYNRTRTETDGYGATLQLSAEHDLAGRENILVVGGSIDYGRTEFGNDTEIGELTADRTVAPAGIFLGGDEFNTSVVAKNRYYGLFVTDTLALTPRLDLTLSGRFNHARIELEDRYGTALNGDHSFNRFNPAAGLTYRWSGGVSTYVSYSEANRVPTAAELSCADRNQPCRFPNAFVADPPLEQVVSRTVEAGARGRLAAGKGGLKIDWSVAPFVTQNDDDIIFVSAGPVVGSGFFQNAGKTQRVGLEAGFNGSYGRLHWFASYAFVRATFADPLTILSVNNPSADANGEIHVDKGDRLPGIPLHSAKLGLSYDVTDKWNIGVTGIFSSSRVYRGDEGNDQDAVDGYAIVNLESSYRLTKALDMFMMVENLFDTDYETFGTYGDAGEVPLRELPGGASDPRFLGPGAPIGVWFGVRVRF